MKKLTLVAALTALSGQALFAQDFTGTWQGTLTAGPQSLRVVMKIAQEGGKLTATNYSIDQTGQPFPAGAVTQSGSAIKITIPTLNGTYEGKLTADGKTINSTWSQGMPTPLNLTKATPDNTWTIPEPPPPMKMMSEDAKPEFEVSTIKPAKPEERFSLLVNPRNGMMNTTATSLSDLIKFAYDLHPKQIVNGPSWLESERFDVTGKPDTAGVPRINQLKSMMQKLLADRFGLKYHLDKKELSVYAITIMKGGVKITEEKSYPNALPGYGGNPLLGFNVRNSTIAEFASILQAQMLDQPVVDQTGLGSARYNFILKFTPDRSMLPPGAALPNAPGGDTDPPPDIFGAFEQQLGLRLQSTKAPADVFVVDHVEQPTAN
jgi:uncharacterized protein (TIGR03435 family)